MYQEGDRIYVSSQGAFGRPIRLTAEELLPLKVAVATETEECASVQRSRYRCEKQMAILVRVPRVWRAEHSSAGYPENRMLSEPKRKENKKSRAMAIGVSMGLIAGTVIGAVTDNVGLWIAIGVAMGPAFGAAIGAMKERKGE